LSIANARDIARGWLVRVAAGEDPSLADAVARHEPDMNALWARAESEHWNRGKKWDTEAKAMYHAHLKPRLGSVKVAAITYTDIKDIHTRLQKTPNAANRTLAVAAKMLKLAELWGLRPVGSNPCGLVKRYPEKKRKRYANGDEIQRIGAAMDALAKDPANLTGIAYLAVLFFSGARPSEIGRASPSMVHKAGDAGVLRIPEGKTGHRDVFLPPQAMRYLALLPAKRERLVGRSGVPRRLWKRVLETAGVSALWARDLRRTFATVALSNGVSLSQVGELLGHKSAQTTKVYALLMEDAAHKAAGQVAGHLEALTNGSSPG